jgi:hypothetical protein
MELRLVLPRFRTSDNESGSVSNLRFMYFLVEVLSDYFVMLSSRSCNVTIPGRVYSLQSSIRSSRRLNVLLYRMRYILA